MVKLLPLNPFSDRNVAIRPINREEHQDRHAELQASISPSIFHQISTSTPLWIRN